MTTGKALFAFRHLPLVSIHPHAMQAAVAAACADEQRRFWPMHDALFARPAALKAGHVGRPATEAGLERSAFERCVDGKTTARVQQDVASAGALGITSTPTFLFGHVEEGGRVRVVRRLTGAKPYAVFRDILTGLELSSALAPWPVESRQIGRPPATAIPQDTTMTSTRLPSRMPDPFAPRRLRRGARVWLLSVCVVTGLPVVARAQPVVEYYHVDALGSVRAVTDPAGAVVARHDYFPFGEEYLAQPARDPLRFTGKERDLETGLDYFGARYDASRTGRFTTADPGHVGGDIFDPQSWNAYAYARNNPLRFVDPTGTEYEINWLNDGQWSRSIASDAAWEDVLSNPGSGFTIQGSNILAFVNGRWVIAGYFSYLGPDQPRTFGAMIQLAGDVAAQRVQEGVTEMAVNAAAGAVFGAARWGVEAGVGIPRSSRDRQGCTVGGADWTRCGTLARAGNQSW